MKMSLVEWLPDGLYDSGSSQVILKRRVTMLRRFRGANIVALLVVMLLSACGGTSGTSKDIADTSQMESVEYMIGPGDVLQIFVWRNPDLSVTIPVRPDGKISTPLVEDMQAVGKSPSQLARDMETELAEIIKSPKVNIIIEQFVGTFSNQIRVVGKASQPRALSYRQDMTLLDVIIEVGGLADGAAGNRAKIIRRYGGSSREIEVRINDLIEKGKISANVKMMPGDVLIIPESRL